MIEKRILLISSRPLEHSGMTKIEMDIIDYNYQAIKFDLACGFDLDDEYAQVLKMKSVKYVHLISKRKVLKYMKDIFNTVKNGDYEKVYIHGNSSLMILEALPAKLAGAKVVTHCHNTKPKRFSAHYYLIKPFFNCLVDYKIGCSKKASEWAYCGKRIITIRNGVDVQRFAYKPTVRLKMRDELGIDNSFVVGHIGTFNAQKNHKRLVDIFEVINRKNPNSKLLLVGDGELYDEIMAYIKIKHLQENVISVRNVDNPEDYYQVMDVLIMPSLFEGLCLVGLEAQASGLPVLLSDTITDEAVVTKKCVMCKLSDDDNDWAEMALTIGKQKRENMSSLMQLKGYSYDEMMSSIRTVLLYEK